MSKMKTSIRTLSGDQMEGLSRKGHLEDLEDLFQRQPDPVPREVAFALHGYLTGLTHAGKITFDDYDTFRKRLPLDGEDLAEAGVNL